MGNFKLNHKLTAALLLSALLAACGGGDSGSAAGTSMGTEAAATPDVLRVGPRVQPASAPQDVSPVKSRSASVAPAPSRVTLGELPSEKAAQQEFGAPMKVGAARDVAATASVGATSSRLQWQDTPSGGKIAAISFAAEGAKGLRLGVLVGKLPGSAMLRIYSQAKRETVFQLSGHEVLQTIDRNLASGETGDAARTWWSPDFGSAEVTLEIELPPGTAPETVEISVPTLSHIFSELEIPTEADQNKGVGDSGTCNLDAVCEPAFALPSDSVARMVFVQNGSSFLCTGTLINTTASDGAPYFLSANHCISTQSAASSLQTDWFYRSPACNVRSLSNQKDSRFKGAQLLYAAADSDTSFMLLADSPPAQAVYAGWDASTPQAGWAVTGLHHPSGDLLKISHGSVSSFASCGAFSGSGFSCNTGTSQDKYLRINWTAGTTEGGSSGSGIFITDSTGNYLVGTLRGGSASCQSTGAPDYYARFDVPYQAALKQWLNANASGPGPAGRTAVFRFYNAGSGAHFFTTSAGERDFVIANNREFAYEGPAFFAYGGSTAGQSAVYRFYNPLTRSHFYTISVAERDLVQQNLAWQYEGTSWFAQTQPGNGATPMYRFYKFTRGTHFFTINAAERNGVIESNKEFNYEGIGYYAWSGG